MTGWSGTLSAVLARTDPVVLTGDTSWSGQELARRAASAADWLRDLGTPAGLAVPALLSATPQALALVIGGAGTDRPIAPLNPRLTVRELTACLAGWPGDLLVAEPARAALATAAAAATGRRLVLLPELPPAAEPLDPARAAGATALVLHTSGTTGVPKPVVVSDERLAARARHNAALLDLGPEGRYATASPFHHIAGIGMLAVALGAGAAVALTPRYTPDEWVRWAALGVTHALLVPTMIVDLLGAGRLAGPALRTLQYGAAPIRPQTLREALAALPGVRLVQFYGQTEGSPLTCLTGADHVRAAHGDEALLATVGRPADGVELRIAQPDGAGIGEVHARAAHLFHLDADGWLHTGDLGRLDPDGYLHLVGRRGDKIVRGGENIYPDEVEAVLAGHPSITDAAVVGVPDDRLGETIKALLVVDGVRPSIEELRAYARERLAGFKVPELWEFVADLPRGPSGKLLRRTLSTVSTVD